MEANAKLTGFLATRNAFQSNPRIDNFARRNVDDFDREVAHFVTVDNILIEHLKEEDIGANEVTGNCQVSFQTSSRLLAITLVFENFESGRTQIVQEASVLPTTSMFGSLRASTIATWRSIGASIGVVSIKFEGSFQRSEVFARFPQSAFSKKLPIGRISQWMIINDLTAKRHDFL
jgi:hypothetical protein